MSKYITLTSNPEAKKEKEGNNVDREGADVGEFVLGGHPSGIRPTLCKTVVSEQTELKPCCSNSTNSPKIR